MILIPLDLIDDNPWQPRQRYDEEKIVELAEDIRQTRAIRPETLGLIHVPVGRIVMPPSATGQHNPIAPGDGNILDFIAGHPGLVRIQLAVGHRRRVAFNYLKNHYGDEWAALPIDLIYLTDRAMLRFAYSENDKRDDITAIEKARAIEAGIKMGYKASELAQEWNLSESAVSNLRRLLQLPDEVQKLVLDRQLDERHARELLPLIQIAGKPKEAAKIAKTAVANGLTAQTVANDVGRILAQYTSTIDPHLLTWENWGDQALPDSCAVVCKGCEHTARQNGRILCDRPDLYKSKDIAWRDRCLALGAATTGLPIIKSDSTYALSISAYQIARDKNCPSLGVGHQPWSWRDQVNVQADLPGIVYTCKKGYDCDCRAGRQESNDDPRAAEREKWEADQQRQADEIYTMTYRQIESYLRDAFQTFNERELALLVLLGKRLGLNSQNSHIAYDLDSIIKYFTLNICGNKRTRVGQAMLERSRIYQLCHINTPIDELKAHLQVIRDELAGAALGIYYGFYTARASIERADEILAAHPGHQDLRDQLAILKSQIENFSQEKKAEAA